MRTRWFLAGTAFAWLSPRIIGAGLALTLHYLKLRRISRV